jgi:hypothetical protein
MEILKKASEFGIEGFSSRKERQGLAEALRRGNRMRGVFKPLKCDQIAKNDGKTTQPCRAIANSPRAPILVL